MRARNAGVVGLVLSALVLGGGGCHREDAAPGPSAPKPAGKAPGPARAAAKPTAAPSGGPASPAKSPAPEALVTPTPGPLPTGMTKYEKIQDIPASAYDVHTTVGGKPATVLLKRDAVIRGVPCAAGAMTFFRNGETFAGCTLAVDFSLEGIPLQKGTEVTLQTDGRFIGFVLPHPQQVLGLPVAAHEKVYLTADRKALSGCTLARAHTFGELSLEAGAKVSFAPNAPGHPLASVKVKGQATLGGHTYGDGVRLYLNPDGTLRMARGVAKEPAAPLTCPAASAVTVTSKRSPWPKGAAFGDVVTAGVIRHNDHLPIAKNPDVAIYLANYTLPAGPPVLFKVDPPAGKALLELRLARTGGAGVTVGTYQVGPAEDADFSAQARLRLPGRSTLTMDAWHTQGSVEVTAVEGDKVCGRFRLEDAHLALQGTFTASAAR